MQVVVKPIGTLRRRERARYRIKQRGHVHIDGPMPMRKAEMTCGLCMEARAAKVLTHLLGREIAKRRFWHRNVFLKHGDDGPTEAEVLEAVREAAAEIALQIIPPEDLPRA